jgi:MFS family permease
MGIYIIALYLGALAAPLIGAYVAAAWDYRAVFVRFALQLLACPR